jgi:ubiquinone/menaquinone biosynthesis C-methylase UbiE
MTSHWTATNRVVGLDAAFNLLRLTRSNGLIGVQADALDLPFADSSFDVALAIELLQQITDASTLIESLTRVTRVGGMVIVATANRWSLIRQAAHAGVGLGLVRRGMPGDIPLPLLRSAREILKIAEGLPLELETMGTTYYPWISGRRHPRMGALRSLLATNFLMKFRRTG